MMLWARTNLQVNTGLSSPMALRSAFFPCKEMMGELDNPTEMMGELDNPTHIVLVIKAHLWYPSCHWHVGCA